MYTPMSIGNVYVNIYMYIYYFMIKHCINSSQSINYYREVLMVTKSIVVTNVLAMIIIESNW